MPFSVYLHKPKNPHNMGAALRAASCFGAQLFTFSARRGQDGRFVRPSSDTHSAWKSIPVLRVDKLFCPHGWVPVVIEITDDACSLVDFEHPERATYIFGPEEGSVPKDLIKSAPFVVKIPSRLCMNLAATVNVVLYDRMAKELRGLSQ